MERRDCDRMFVAVLETGSFSKAAGRLGVSSGQASKLVSRLEAELGVQLLKRSTRALSPTEIGLAYFGRVKTLLEDFDALDASVRNATGSAMGLLKLSVPLSFGVLQLSPALMKFASEFPLIKLDIAYSDRLVNLVDEGFDLAIRIGNPEDSSLIARKLCDIRIVLVASHAYLEQAGEPTAPMSLLNHACIVDTNFHEPFTWRFRPKKEEEIAVSVTGRLRLSNAQACLAAAEAGLGIARIPSFVAGPSLQARKTKALLQDFENQHLGIYALYPPNRHLAAKLRALVDFLAQYFRGSPAWDQGW